MQAYKLITISKTSNVKLTNAVTNHDKNHEFAFMGAINKYTFFYQNQ